MKRSLALVLGALTTFALVGSTAGAAATVEITSAAASGGATTVSGTVAFPTITTPESVLGEEAVFGAATVPADVMNAAGLGLTDAKIVPIAGGLRFIWEVASMPAQVPPEGVRYNWAVMIGTNTYQLQAKRTSIASVNFMEDPKGHIEQAAAQKSFFQLRGNCVTNYFPGPQAVNGCYHYAFLNGTFDIANKQISMDWPYETRDAINRIVAPDFKPGVTLTHCGPPFATASCDKSAGMSIATSLQAVVSNQNISNWINSWNSYYVGGRVQLGAGSAGADPATVTYGPAVSLSGGTFTGTVGGLGGSTSTIYARACNGETCAYDSFPD